MPQMCHVFNPQGLPSTLLTTPNARLSGLPSSLLGEAMHTLHRLSPPFFQWPWGSSRTVTHLVVVGGNAIQWP